MVEGGLPYDIMMFSRRLRREYMMVSLYLLERELSVCFQQLKIQMAQGKAFATANPYARSLAFEVAKQV